MIVCPNKSDSKWKDLKKGLAEHFESEFEDYSDEEIDNLAHLAFFRNKGEGIPSIEQSIKLLGESAKDIKVYTAESPFIRSFIENDVNPILKKIGEGFADGFDKATKLLNPKYGVNEKVLDSIFKTFGSRTKARIEIDKAFRAVEKMFDKMVESDRIDFIDKMKRGEPQSTPELEAISKSLRESDEALYNEILKYKPSLEWKENHFRVLWKVIPGTDKENFLSGLFRRAPLQGGKGFMKRATLVDMSAGIAKGGVPYSTNPITLFKLAHADAMKFISAQRMMEGLKDDGFAVFVKTSAKPPEGYVRLNDKVSKVYYPSKGGIVNAGEYFIEEGAARLLNNHLSRDYVRESKLGKGLLELKNAFTAAELGFSGFHGVAIGLEATGSNFGIAFRKLINLGKFGEFAKDLFGSPLAPRTLFKLGRDYINFATKSDFENSEYGKAFLQKNPSAKEYLDAYFNSGGLLSQHEDFKVNSLKSLKEQAGKDNYIGAAFRVLPSINEAIMSPLFDVYIPSVKIGNFMKEYPLSLEENKTRIAKGLITETEIARKVNESIDNRYGEMNFDNLFWDRTFKSASQFFLRSVTWKLGNIRQMGGAPIEQLAEFKSAFKEGRKPMLSPKMSWLFGLATMQVIYSTATQMLSTGKKPDQFKDFIAPRINKNDDKERVIMPTYGKDLLHILHAIDLKGVIGGTLDYITSSTSGVIGKLNDLWNNKDFYNYEIYNSEGSIPEKSKEIAWYLLPKPFSITSTAEMINKGEGGKAALSFLGLTKAPSYLINDNIENKIFDLYQLRNASVKPFAEREVEQAKKEVKELYKNGKIEEAQKKADEYTQKGKLKPVQVKNLFKEASSTQPPSVYFFNRLPKEDKEFLLKEMDEEQLKIYDPRGLFKNGTLLTPSKSRSTSSFGGGSFGGGSFGGGSFKGGF